MPKSKHITPIRETRVSENLGTATMQPYPNQAGFWEMQTGSGSICWSLMARAIFEVPDNYMPNLEKMLSFCGGEEDKNILKTAIADCAQYGTPFEKEIDIITYRGNRHRVSIRGKAVGRQGNYTRIYGSIVPLESERTTFLENTLEHNKEMLDALPDLLIEVDASGNILLYHAPDNLPLLANRQLAVGRNIADALEHGNGIVAAVKTCLHDRKTCRYEFTMPVKQHMLVYEARVLPIGTERSLLLIRNITDSEKEEAELKQNEQKYTRLIEKMNIGLLEINHNEIITRTKAAFCKMSGYNENELVGTKATRLFLAPHNHLNRPDPETFETRLQKKTGDVIDVLVSGAPLYNQGGKIIGSVNIVYDITEQKRTSRLLEKSVRIGNVGVFEIDVKQNKIIWNTEMRLFFEIDETYHPSFEEVLHYTTEGAERNKAMQLLASMRKEKTSCDEIFEIQTKSGIRKWIRIMATSEFADHGAIRILGIAVDVTKTVEYEKILEAHSDLSNTILSSIQDGFYVVDEYYTVKFINESGAAYIGKPMADLLGKNIWEVFPEANDLFHDAFERVKTTKQSEQITHHLYIGDVGRWFHIKLYPTRKGGISVFYRDVSKEKEAEESIRNLNDRYSAISAATNQVIYEWNFSTQQIEFNEVYYHVTGYKNIPETKTAKFNLQLVHPDDRKSLEKSLKECFEVNKPMWSGVYRFKIADGSYRNMHSRGIIRYAKKNEALRMLGTIEDITERERLNEKLIREQVSAQRKINEAVLDAQEKERAFIGRELHDNVNQILTTASLYLELAETEGFKSTQTVHEVRALIRKGIEEIRLLSRQLTPPILRDIGLSVAIKDLVSLVAKASPIHFSVNMGTDIVHELSNEKSLVIYRICQELLNNVIKYSEAVNCFIILDQPYQKRVRLIVKDDGKGFDSKITKKGVGLNSTVTRVEIYGGTFRINCLPGKGCTVIVEIPL